MKRQFLLILFFHPLLLVLLLYSVFVYLNCVCVCVSLRSHRGNIFSSNIHNSVCNCLRIFLVQTQCHLMNDLKSVMVHGTSKQNNNSNNKWSQHTACTFPKALFLQAFLRMVSATILFQIPFLNLFFFSPFKFSFSLVAHKARRKRFKTIIIRIFVWHLWKKNGVFSSTRRQNDAYKICTKKCIKERRWEREREATSQDAIQLSYRFHVYFKCTNIEKETGIKETHNDDYIFEGYSNVALICQLLRGR